MENQTLQSTMNTLAGLMTDLEARKAAYEASVKDITDRIKDLQDQVRTEVLNRGETVKGDRITVIWNKGKTTWDGKLLEGYALAHPDVLAARKVGEPTVSFRLARKAE